MVERQKSEHWNWPQQMQWSMNRHVNWPIQNQFYWSNVIDINGLIKDFCINIAHTRSIQCGIFDNKIDHVWGPFCCKRNKLYWIHGLSHETLVDQPNVDGQDHFVYPHFQAPLPKPKQSMLQVGLDSDHSSTNDLQQHKKAFRVPAISSSNIVWC